MTTNEELANIADAEQSVDLSTYDLNLFITLHALLRSRNITHASADLEISSPSTTRALGKLRELFADPLLVRYSRSFDLTPLAEALTPKVDAFLVNADRIFGEGLPAPERFTVAMPDHLGLSLSGRLTAFFREISPATMFIPVFNLSGVLTQLEEGRIDLAVGMVEDAPSGYFCRTLPGIRCVCLARVGHEAIGGSISFADFHRYLSVRIGTSFNAGFGDLQDGLEALRPSGGEVLTVPDIHTAARLAEETDALLVLPVPTANFLADRYQVTAFVPAGCVSPPDYQVSLVWHERWHRRSLHAAVRSFIASYVVEGSDEAGAMFA